VGGLHVWNQRTVYQQVPDPELVADALMEFLGSEEQYQLIKELLLKIRTDWYMAWVRKHDLYQEIMAKLAVANDDQGLLTIYGEPELAIRATPPGDHCEVIPPEKEPTP
jgi:hypothetical protein